MWDIAGRARKGDSTVCLEIGLRNLLKLLWYRRAFESKQIIIIVEETYSVEICCKSSGELYIAIFEAEVSG